MKEDKQQFVLISSGGTGGHMSPASALADDLRARDVRVEVITDPRGKKFESMFKNIPMHVVKSGTAGAGLMGKVKGGLHLIIGMAQAYSLVKRLQPDLVIGFGGYPSVPGVWAAQRLKTKTILHEQNAVIGKANAFLVAKAARIALSLPHVTGLDKDEQMRSVLTGNPVRPEISALREAVYTAPDVNGKMQILIMGGSLGATVFSKIVPQTLSQLSKEHRKRLYIVQQCREADIDEARKVYEEADINAELSTFIHDVAGELAKAHLVIGRSGASTVAEVSIAGRPAIYVPYPHHKDQQQKRNADAIADEGGAWVMTESGFTQEALLTRIETFMQNPETLTNAAKKARECGQPDAAHKLGNLAIAVMNDYKNG